MSTQRGKKKALKKRGFGYSFYPKYPKYPKTFFDFWVLIKTYIQHGIIRFHDFQVPNEYPKRGESILDSTQSTHTPSIGVGIGYSINLGDF